MEVGESGTVVFPPELGYGDFNPKNVRIVARNEVPDGYDLVEGSVLGWRNPVTKRILPVRVVGTYPDYVKLDYNHPLAGKTLEYWIELVDIVDA